MPAREKVVAARRSLFATALLLTAGLSATSEAASECRAYDAGARPRIGLVLGGGGARGGAHVGVLKFLEEQRIPVDMIAGTSMGALVGGLYSVGMDAGEIEQLLQNTNWAGMFDDKSSRDEQPLRRKLDDDLGLYGPKLGVGKDSTLLPAGALAGQKVGLLLERLISSHHESADFDLLPIPYRAVASDLVSGNMVLLDRGKLALAMRASMSVPGAFDPVRQGDALLVDGGITRNLPIDIARQMGADRVIAVNVGYPKLGADELRNVLSIVGQLTTLMVQGNTEAQIATLAPGDVLIEPALGTDFSSADFNRLAEIVPLGYTASMALAQQLAQFSVPEAEYRAWRRSISSCESGVPVIHFIRLDNRSRFADDVLSRMITLQPGQPLDYARLERDISRIYGLGFIRHARYSIVEEGGRQGLLIEVEQDVRGSDFVETGLGITNAGRGTSLDFKVAYLKTDITDRGAEFRTAMQFGEEFGVNAELYLPVDDKLQWIFRPDLRAHERDILVFDETAHPLGQLQLQEIGGSLVFGREFARHSGLFLGASSYVGDISVSVGYPSGLGDYRYHGGEWKLQFIYDRLDSRFLPSEGSSLRLSYNKASESLGADDVFEQWSFQWFTARSWGPHTGWIGSSLFTSVDDRAPVYALYSGGGFLNMSGYERDALVGENFGYSLLGYRYRMGAGGLLPAYVGMTVEYGNAAERLQDVYGNGILNGSFYLGYDSPLGPLYLGYGWSEDTSGLLFLRLGNVLGAQSIGRR